MGAIARARRLEAGERLLAGRPNLIGAGFMLACALAGIALQNGVSPDGDGPYYLLMQQGFVRDGVPAISRETLQWLQARPDIAEGFRPEFLTSGLDGRIYALHFWFYSLLSAPFALLISAGGGDPIYALALVNVLFACGAGAYAARTAALSPAAKALLLASFGATSVNWYAAWPHPEVVTAAFVLVSALALAERRWLVCACCAGLGALQNPSVALMLPVAAGAALAAHWPGREWRKLAEAAAAIGMGVALALVAPAFSLAIHGVGNPIAAAGYVDVSRIGLDMLGQYLFDLNQGAAIGMPFLAVGGLVVGVRRLLAWRRDRTVRLLAERDWLALAALAITAPLLAQINFNSGQYYVLRYVAWSLAPLLVWLALEFDRAPRAIGQAWIAGLAFYAMLFAAFLAAKFSYVQLSRRDPELPGYCDWCAHKPWTRAVLDLAPSLYNPEPSVFAERSLRGEAGARSAIGLPIAYRREDGVITKVLTRPTLGLTGLCSGAAVARSHLTMTYARDGLVYLNGALVCAASAPRRAGGPSG